MKAEPKQEELRELIFRYLLSSVVFFVFSHLFEMGENDFFGERLHIKIHFMNLFENDLWWDESQGYVTELN